MKVIFALLTVMSLNVFADPSYDLSGDRACVLQIMKEVAPSLVIACAGDTLVNNPTQPYSQMQDSATFQAEAKRIFLSRFDSAGLTCKEYDNSTAYILICKKGPF